MITERNKIQHCVRQELIRNAHLILSSATNTEIFFVNGINDQQIALMPIEFNICNHKKTSDIRRQSHDCIL